MATPSRGKHAVLVGAGTIGSHAIRHLARTPGVAHLTLVDPGSYERANLATQDIGRDDVGAPKAIVQSRRLRRIDPALSVDAVADAVENVPLARLRADLLLTGVDNNRARQTVNEVSLRLGVPWIDAAVEPEGLLARVNVWVPGPERPCLECGWSDRDYERLEAPNRPCDRSGAVGGARPTNAPSALGALAASLLAIEALKLLAGSAGPAPAGRQVLIAAEHHRHYVTITRRNPRCRVGGHEAWTIRPLEAPLERATVGQLLERASGAGADRARSLGLPGHPFVRTLACSACGHTRPVLRLARSLRDVDLVCDACDGGTMHAAGLDLADEIPCSDLAGDERDRSLRVIGFHAGDVIRIGRAGGGHRYFEIRAERAAGGTS